MRRYPLFYAIPLSFFSAELYQDVAQRWKGLGFLYLFIIALLVSAVALSFAAVQLMAFDLKEELIKFYQEDITSGKVRFEDMVNSGLAMAAQLPPVEFKDGKAITAVSQPYEIIEPITKKRAFIIDTTGKVTSLSGTEASILLTANSVITKKDEGREEVRYLNTLSAEEQAQFSDSWHVLEQLPLVQVKEGKAQTDVAQPYYFKDRATGEKIGVIDTTGSITSLNGSTMKFLLTKEQLFFRLPNAEGIEETKKFDLANIKEEQLIAFLQDVAPAIKKMAILAILLFIPVWALLKFVPLILGALLLGLVGIVFAALLKARLPYEVLVRLGSVAATPGIIAYTLLPLSGWVGAGVAIAYLLFAVSANRAMPVSPASPAIR